MTKQIFFFIASTIFLISCSKDEEQILPLMIERIDGFVSTGTGTFQVTDLLATAITTNVQTTSPFFVFFSRPVQEEWLKNESLPKLMKKENGEFVSAVRLSFTTPSPQEITIEPAEALEPGATYGLVINPGYEAMDGGVLEEHVIADFVTSN